jgi:hypothetical protein
MDMIMVIVPCGPPIKQLAHVPYLSLANDIHHFQSDPVYIRHEHRKKPMLHLQKLHHVFEVCFCFMLIP